MACQAQADEPPAEQDHQATVAGDQREFDRDADLAGAAAEAQERQGRRLAAEAVEPDAVDAVQELARRQAAQAEPALKEQPDEAKGTRSLG